MKKLNLVFLFSILSVFCVSCSFINPPEKVSENNDTAITTTPSEFELSILTEINLARKNPKAYFDSYIAPKKSSFSTSYFNSCKNDSKRQTKR